MMPSMPERRTHDYVRNQHRASEFKTFLTTIDKTVPEGLDIHIACDNYATHKTPAIKAWLARHPRVHLHFTLSPSLSSPPVTVVRPCPTSSADEGGRRLQPCPNADHRPGNRVGLTTLRGSNPLPSTTLTSVDTGV